MIFHWPFEASQAHQRIPSSACLICPYSFAISEPFLHVGSPTLSHMQDSHTYICIKLSYFLLLICLISVWLLISQKNLDDKVCFSLTQLVKIFLTLHCVLSVHWFECLTASYCLTLFSHYLLVWLQVFCMST